MQRDVNGAEAAFQRAINSGHVKWANIARGILKELHRLRQRNVAKVDVNASQGAVPWDHGDLVLKTVVSLGRILTEQGDVAGALFAYQRVIDSGHAWGTPEALMSLGRLLAEQGDVASAQVAYQWVIDSSHAMWAPGALVSVGLLLGEQGDVAGARAAYQRAIDSGHAMWAPIAKTCLKELKRSADEPRWWHRLLP